MSRSEVSTALKRTVHFNSPAAGTIETMYASEQIQRSPAAILLRSLANCACPKGLSVTTVWKRHYP
jgi:hypothetical protein